MPAEMIAIVGMACRLPSAPDPDAFWQLLRDGRSAVATAPQGRMDLSRDGEPPAGVPSGPTPATAHNEPAAGTGHSEQAAGSGHGGPTQPGAFLDRVDEFDAGFFGISPRQAAAMDPQQRLMLELAWEALEDAGIGGTTLRRFRTAVLVGAMWDDYAALTMRAGAQAIGPYTMAGMSRGLIANRISHALGLHGPSLTVDTAQSSSLVAVHMAAEMLRGGDCTLAVAGGVNLNIVPERALAALRFGGLSPAGQCFTFDERADGYARGEGGAVVVLKPLARAMADGDLIYCVIRGSAVNTGSAEDALTVPSARAQEEVLRLAHARAGADPALVQYVELHGTGTRAGDPVEAAALGAALRTANRAGSPLLVGSAKTNVGHLESAAGIVGLVKTALSISRRQIPASLNFQTFNPRIPATAPQLRVQTETGPWPDPDRPLLAGVSAFGMGGSNCHVVLAEWPEVSASTPFQRPAAPAPGDSPFPFVLSGRDPAALRQQAQRLRARVLAQPELQPADVGYSLVTTRSRFSHRAVVIGSSRAELMAGLCALADGQPAAAVIGGVAGDAGRTVFAFGGHGSQWAGMGLDLLGFSEAFAERIGECDAALAGYTGWSVLDVLRGEVGAPPLERPDVVQPVLFAVTVSLAELWRSFGVEADAVVGHSLGEIAAACVAGGLSLDDCARLVALRGRAVLAVAGAGAMASVALPASQVEDDIAAYGGAVGVAALNGPASTAVSGDSGAIAGLVAAYQRRGVQVRPIDIGYASHSPHIDQVRDEMVMGLSGLTPVSSKIAFYSTVTGCLLDTASLDAGYWYRNLRDTVQFQPAISALSGDGHRTFIETSPHPVLAPAIAETLSAQAGGQQATRRAIGTLRRGDGGGRRFLASLGQAHAGGTAVAWDAAFTGRGARRVRLPTYPFQRRRYWLDQPPAVPAGTGPQAGGNPAARPAIRPDSDAGRRFPDFASKRRDSQAHGPLLPPLAGLSESRQHDVLVELVRTHAAAVLGHAAAADVPADRPLAEAGLDSMAAVELRGQLAAAVGDDLPTTLVFDHPTPAALARYLRGLIAAGAAPAAPAPAGIESAGDEELFQTLDRMLSRDTDRPGAR